MKTLTKVVIYTLLGLACLTVLIKVVEPTKQTDTQIPTNSSQLAMEWSEVVATGVSSDEKDLIISFVDTFEHAIAQRDSEKVLSFFSAPETDEEQSDLDFILGSDYARNGAKSLARLFTTQGYNFSTSAHYVRNVGAQGANVRVIVDELRIMHSGGEWVGYIANVSRMIVELRETSHGYQILRYYHQDPSNNNNQKYEGFVAK
ncbi:hypothetical protein A2115_00545 [Candidatus Woesebacteria bacterium GWA1_41_8]|uniref:SnoaL-like domain-containing protein n=1 Tax=Candidatus Woesebacteria bacterium GWA1_41_8 TaxID=1802471 RepID=A0A1F7WII1_9BACT|nr:MAG: hypothetical protein A2115_00545 [Candidatus Woesebacteria bacterium GWA1_41_8]